MVTVKGPKSSLEGGIFMPSYFLVSFPQSVHGYGNIALVKLKNAGL